MARLRLLKGYRVLGSVRKGAATPPPRLIELGIGDEVEYVPFDLLDQACLVSKLERLRPDELYNLGAQSLVGRSFEQPIDTAEIDALGPARLLEAIRSALPSARYYQASTSEMLGLVARPDEKQSERHPFHPLSPYGAAKAYAHWLTINYRERYGQFAVAGILFNHESPLRSRQFVTRKITSEMAEIRHGLGDVCRIGNLDTRRDWGFAGDYVEGVWLMLQTETAADFVLATGRSESIRRFVDLAADALGFDLEWRGSGKSEQGVNRKSGKIIVEIDPGFYRPADIPAVLGDPREAKKWLGWEARLPLEELVHMMVQADEIRIRQR